MFDYEKHPQHELLKPVIGLRVTHLWAVASALVVRFDGDAIAMFEVVEPPVGLPIQICAALSVDIGTVHPGATFNDLDATPQPAMIKELIGERFDGLEGDIVCFENYGVQVTPTAFLFLRRKAGQVIH